MTDKYIRLDRKLWKDLKLMSVKLETNMKALAEEYIREGLKKEKKSVTSYFYPQNINQLKEEGKMKIREMVQKRIEEGNEPRYLTKRGKLLWVDTEHHDDYSGTANCKILIDASGKFWGYSDSKNIQNIN